MSTRGLVLLVFALVAGAAVTAYAVATADPSPVSDTATPPQPTTAVTPAQTTSTEAEGAIHVVVELPEDWSTATIEAITNDYRDVELRWRTTGPRLDVTLPGPGAYWFWAESPSSSDGLCFYEAQSDTQWKQTELVDGGTIRLEFSGEICD